MNLIEALLFWWLAALTVVAGVNAVWSFVAGDDLESWLKRKFRN